MNEKLQKPHQNTKDHLKTQKDHEKKRIRGMKDNKKQNYIKNRKEVMQTQAITSLIKK